MQVRNLVRQEIETGQIVTRNQPETLIAIAISPLIRCLSRIILVHKHWRREHEDQRPAE